MSVEHSAAEDGAAEDERELGRVLGGTYRLERRLGAGGMGAVYEAAHLRTGRRYAVKVLLPEIGKRADARRRFQREAEAIGALGHANIVAVHDFAEDGDGLAYLVMDLLEGEDLAARMKRVGAMSLADAARIVSEIAAGLDAAHARGLAHRDLKPANVFLAVQPGAPERAVVLDFGLVRSFALEGELESRLTVSGVVMGTPLYMSPEQASGLPVDARADVYALATMAFEMIAGEPPFHAPTLPALFAKLVTDPPPSIRLRRGELSADVDEVLSRALAKEPADRPASAGALAAALSDALGLAPALGLGATQESASPAATPVGNPAHSWPRGADVDVHAPTLATPSGVAPTRASASAPTPTQPKQAPRRLPWILAGVAITGFMLFGAIGGALLYQGLTVTDVVVVEPAGAASPAASPAPQPAVPMEVLAPRPPTEVPSQPAAEATIAEVATEEPATEPEPVEASARRSRRAARPTANPAPANPAAASRPISVAGVGAPTSPPIPADQDPVAQAANQNAAGDPAACLRTLQNQPASQRVLGMRFGCAVNSGDAATLRRVCADIRSNPNGAAYRSGCDSLSPAP